MKPCQKLLSLKTMSKIIFKKSSKILLSKLFKLLLKKRCQSISKFSLFPKIFGFNVVITLALHFVLAFSKNYNTFAVLQSWFSRHFS